MATTLDQVLATLIREATEDRGGVVKATARFTGDDGDGVAEVGDVAAPNVIKTEGADGSISSIGGRDTSGNFKLDFDTRATAMEFNCDFVDTLAGIRAALAAPTGGVDVVENVLKVIAEQMFNGTVKADANFSGDNVGDAINFPGANILGVQGSDMSEVIVGGRGTSGNFVFDFDDQATAQNFLEVARVVNQWGADFF